MKKERLIKTLLAPVVIVVCTTALALSATYPNVTSDPAPETHTEFADLGPGCRVRAHLPFDGRMGGGYDPESATYGGSFSIRQFPGKEYSQLSVNIFCSDANEEREIGWARYDLERKQWVHRYMDEEDQRQRQHFSEIYQVNGVNSEGYVVTVDEFTGEESRRDRRMYFCLFRLKHALCGEGFVMKLVDPETDVLPYVMQILRSIEFIDDASSEDAEKPLSNLPYDAQAHHLGTPKRKSPLGGLDSPAALSFSFW